MKKIKIITISILFFLCFLLVGCGSNEASKRNYLTFYVWGDSQELSWYEAIAKEYEKEYGVEVKVQPNSGDYYNNLNIKLGSKKSAPDIFFTETGEIQGQLNQRKLLNLSDYIKNGAIDVVSDSNPNGKIKLWDINDCYRYDGNNLGSGDYYALIKDWSPDFVMWYNKNHIDEYNEENGFEEGDEGFINYPSEEIPMTWDEFYELSYKLTKKVNGVTRYGTMLDRVPWKHLMEFIQMNGSSLFDSERKYINSSDEKVIEAFKFFIDLQKGEKASAPEIGVSSIGSGEAFANGNTTFVWFGSWAYSNYFWNSVPFEIGMAPAPVPKKGRPLTKDDTYLAASGLISLAIYADSPVKDEAVKFLNFYMTYGEEYMAKKGFNIPGNELVARSDIFRNPENSRLRKINNYFYNLALNYTHSLTYNKYLSQILVENQIAKNVSTWFNNYSAETYESVLEKIRKDVMNEID